MMEIDFDKKKILKYVGDLTQIFGVKEYTLNGGKSQGVRAVDIRNGTGLEFTVFIDRCMDIAWLSYKGINFSYISKTGIVSPQYYNETGINFLRSFYAGFLTTCGLRNVGTPCVENGESFGLHGRISNTPAENVYSGVEWYDDKPIIRIKGRMREARVFGENMILEREIICRCGENKFTIEDRVENYGFVEEPLMLLYHFNLGYPLLQENAILFAPTKEVRPKDEEAKKGIENCTRFQKPTSGYNEQVFYHDLRCDDNRNTCVALINDKLELGVAIRFNKNELFNFTQWKMMSEGEYVLGLEPCNCYVCGREESKKKGVIEYLKPGEIRKFKIEVEILDGKKNIERLKNEILDLSSKI